MAALRVLVDTDILIDYFNSGRYGRILDDRRHVIYYSIVTRKELFAKEGRKDSERRAMIDVLQRFRVVPLTRAIAARYAAVRRDCPRLEREDALIAATAIDTRLPLLTRNWRHFRQVEGVTFYTGIA